MKKLKKNPSKLEEQKKNPLKKKLIFKKKGIKQCDFFYPDGTQCKNSVRGKGNFCSTHAENIFPEKRNNPIAQSNSLFVKYDPINHPRLFIQYSSQGLNPHEIAAEFRVSMQVLQEWRENNILFDQACEIGKSAFEAWYLRTGKYNLHNRWFQTPLFKFLAMNNGLGWTDKMDSRSQVQGQYGVLLMPGQMSVDDWEAQNIKREEDMQKRLEAEEILSASDTTINQE